MPDTPPLSRSITIQGIEFQVRWPYTEGHTCSAVEAEALNMARAENVRNNFSKRVKAATQDPPTEGADPDSLNEEFIAYDSAYEFGILSPRSQDPVGREAKRIAQIIVREQLNRAGKQESDIDAERLKAMVDAASQLPAVKVEAQRRLSAMANVAEDALAEITAS